MNLIKQARNKYGLPVACKPARTQAALVIRPDNITRPYSIKSGSMQGVIFGVPATIELKNSQVAARKSFKSVPLPRKIDVVIRVGSSQYMAANFDDYAL